MPGRMEEQDANQFFTNLSLELESRFGLETQVGTSHRKQRNVVSLTLGTTHRTALSSLEMQPSWTWRIKYSTAVWADAELTQEQKIRAVRLTSCTASDPQSESLCSNVTQISVKDITDLKSFVPISRTTEAYPAQRLVTSLYTMLEPRELHLMTEQSTNWTLQNFWVLSVGFRCQFWGSFFPTQTVGILWVTDPWFHIAFCSMWEPFHYVQTFSCSPRTHRRGKKTDQ